METFNVRNPERLASRYGDGNNDRLMERETRLSIAVDRLSVRVHHDFTKVSQSRSFSTVLFRPSR